MVLPAVAVAAAGAVGAAACDSSGHYAQEATLFGALWSVYLGRWLQTGLFKVVGLISVACTPLLIKLFLEQLQLHTATVAGSQEPGPLWTLYALVPAMSAMGFLYTFCWHQYMQKCIRIGCAAGSPSSQHQPRPLHPCLDML